MHTTLARPAGGTCKRGVCVSWPCCMLAACAAVATACPCASSCTPDLELVQGRLHLAVSPMTEGRLHARTARQGAAWRICEACMGALRGSRCFHAA